MGLWCVAFTSAELNKRLVVAEHALSVLINDGLFGAEDRKVLVLVEFPGEDVDVDRSRRLNPEHLLEPWLAASQVQY